MSNLEFPEYVKILLKFNPSIAPASVYESQSKVEGVAGVEHNGWGARI